jgi:pilus assembly protein Flp/PilA
MKAIMNFIREEEGVTAIEYGLIAALIAIVIVASVQIAGTQLNIIFKKVANCLTAAAGTGTCP